MSLLNLIRFAFGAREYILILSSFLFLQKKNAKIQKLSKTYSDSVLYINQQQDIQGLKPGFDEIFHYGLNHAGLITGRVEVVFLPLRNEDELLKYSNSSCRVALSPSLL